MSRKTYDKKRKKWFSNMPLYKNPQKHKTEKSHIRYGIITAATYGGEWQKTLKIKIKGVLVQAV